jgi:hypothetical protein
MKVIFFIIFWKLNTQPIFESSEVLNQNVGIFLSETSVEVLDVNEIEVLDDYLYIK